MDYYTTTTTELPTTNSEQPEENDNNFEYIEGDLEKRWEAEQEYYHDRYLYADRYVA